MKDLSLHQNFKHMLHGGDYNPEQWKQTPEIWDEDMRLMKLANCNVSTVGIFSWVNLEPEEGKFNFSWLDTIMDKLATNGISAVLANPSGARPYWLSQKYPEATRVGENRVRNLHGGRHNHCFTSPIYRKKVHIITEKLAKRYKDHPALILWHASNEYEGECHCELCQDAFRNWLKKKYAGDLDKLNKSWWTGFWSHEYTDWSQIESPSPIGEMEVHGLNIDWKRFITDQTLDFFKNEIEPMRRITPNIPITTNFHEFVNINSKSGLNYWKFAPYLDIISWDNYPYWHGEHPDWIEGSRRAFIHDINRSLKKGKSFLMMESSPSATNWQPVAKLRRPDMHMLASMQAIAHGSDSVQYFQWRKSRGSSEKFHGAVVDHCGHENTRVFKEVAQLGETLQKLAPVVGTTVKPDVAIIYDWENSWAIEDAQGPCKDKKNYEPTCQSHYRPFFNNGVPVDVIDMDSDFSTYKLLIAPMLYMVRPGVAERIEKFVENGGTFVTTYWSGIVDENDLCFLNGFPGPLRKVTGIWSEEIDALYDNDINYAVSPNDNKLGLSEKYEIKDLCDLIHDETAQVLATYKDDFYSGRPALTENSFGKGKSYYIAFRNNEDFLEDFYQKLIDTLNIKKALDTELPEGVTTQIRSDGEREFIFVLNFSPEQKEINLKDMQFKDMVTENELKGIMSISGYGVKVLERIFE